jgi:hypothetical protein
MLLRTISRTGNATPGRGYVYAEKTIEDFGSSHARGEMKLTAHPGKEPCRTGPVVRCMPTLQSPAHEAILERIGHTLAQIDADIAQEPLPEPVRACLQSRITEETNVLCALVEALTEPDRFVLLEYAGELYIHTR